MLRELAVNTNVIIYLMVAVGVLGVLAKIVNQLTLRRLVKASSNMSKSTHKLIKLVRAKYEHACMIHDSVENINSFVEKYIYEYRGFLFRIHTWRQVEILAVWFAGILAAIGASAYYLSFGFNESVYQYIASGIAEIVLLSVVIRLSDEPYKINAVKMYMTDYLENICTIRLKRQRQTEQREEIDVIAAENSPKTIFQSASQNQSQNTRGVNVGTQKAKGQRAARKGDTAEEVELSISIEGEPRNVEQEPGLRAESKQPVRKVIRDREEDEDRPAVREEAIRQILEEFLA